MIDILLPTYKRPSELQRIATNIEDTTHNKFALWFGLEADDYDGQLAAVATGHNMRINQYAPSYSNTIQALYESSKFPFIIHANDDFEFHQDWDITPLSMFERKDLMVVGLKQTEGDDHGSAISLFRRKYIEEQSGVVDMPNRIFYPYNHNYVDTEFTQTAQSRNVWAICEPRVITHLHPGFTGRLKDQTFLKNEAMVNVDNATFESRKHLWGM